MVSHRSRVRALVVVIASFAVACGGDGGATTEAEPSPTDALVATPVASADATADDSFDPELLRSNVGDFPALDNPHMVPGRDATWLRPDDVVLGVVAEDGEARAFPISQMAYHHVANTTLAGEPYLVTY